MNIMEVVALVTGGASGLGEATVLELARMAQKLLWSIWMPPKVKNWRLRIRIILFLPMPT